MQLYSELRFTVLITCLYSELRFNVLKKNKIKKGKTMTDVTYEGLD